MVFTNDLALVLGIIMTIVAVPLLLNAWAEDRPVRMGALLAIAGVALVSVAIGRHPGNFGIGDVPAAFQRVFRDLSD